MTEQEGTTTSFSIEGGPDMEKALMLSSFLGILLGVIAVFVLMNLTNKRTFWYVVLFFLIGSSIGGKGGMLIGSSVFKEKPTII